MVMDDDRKQKMDARWDALVAQGISPDEAESTVRREFSAPKRPLTPDQIARLGKGQAEKNAADKVSLLGGAVDAILEATQTVAAGFPGAKVAMSAGRSLLTGEPLADVQRDINERTSDVPYASAIGRAAGSYAALGAGPLANLSAAKGGAALLGLDELFNNDPDSDLSDRIRRGATGALTGLLVGKGAELLTTGARAVLAPSLGKVANRLRDAVVDSDNALYSAAKAEGDAVGSNAAIRIALKLPGIKPFADIVRQSETFAGANDAEILRETYKLLSEKAIQAGKTITNAADHKAGTALEKADIKLLQQTLRAAGATAMPSFPKAVAEHARLSKISNAFSIGANAARRELNNASLVGEKQVKLSPEGTRRALSAMTPEQAAGATAGILGRTSEMMTPNSNIINLFGVPRAIRGVYRAGPLLRAADKASGSNASLGAERGLLAFLAGR